MAQNPIITAIDIGTDKCVTLIATETESGLFNVVGVSAVQSKGMKRSQIIDLEQVLSTITESLDGAERMAGFDVQSAFLSISGTHISSLNSKGVVAVASPDQEITSEDVNRVIDAAKAISLPSDREILHVVAKDFKVDSQEGIKDPVGMTGVRLETEAHIITGITPAVKNIEKCILDLGLQVDAFVFSGLASAEVVLSETEKELGVVVVDIGAGSTSVCAYVDGSLEYSVALPIGARHITQDIALGCRISLDVAEQIKISLSKESLSKLMPHPGESKQEFNKRRKKADELRLADFDPGNQEIRSKRTIVEAIMMPRIKEIFNMVGAKLSDAGVLSDVPAGLVITGGGAMTVGIQEVAKRELRLPARIGMPMELTGLTTDIHTPAHATSIGLLHYGRKTLSGHEPKGFDMGELISGFVPGNLAKKITDWFKSLAP